ncbi:MAG: 1-acyl-sn-glycerol-3-phosphate acyltransferase [Oscillospiraceae bacterium]|nr:1-acyl-sn-glycerol-3-phosphate acyltransferase [Oscillospiraceae bacterium]
MSHKLKKKASYKFYRGAFHLTRAFFGLFCWLDIRGQDKIPKGAAMVCSNHSSLTDPLFVAFAFGVNCFLHFIAKIELFKIPVLSCIVVKLGAISVDRDMQDIETIKQTLSHFKKGEKVAIFPEGTRATHYNQIEPKSGAVKIAERAGVPIVPIFVPRRKKIFQKLTLIIGEPYQVERLSGRRSAEEYQLLANDLMSRIESLNPEAAC